MHQTYPIGHDTTPTAESGLPPADKLVEIGHSALSEPDFLDLDFDVTQPGTPAELGKQELIPPPGFVFDEDLADMGTGYEEQVRYAVKEHEYQLAPLPSFEAIPRVDITPTFNPTNADPSEVFARGKHIGGAKLYSEWDPTAQPVRMWRIEERARVDSGTGLTSSHIVRFGSLGSTEKAHVDRHLNSSTHEERTQNPDSATSFVSFSSDPKFMVNTIRRGFGSKDGRDSIIVEAIVPPDRFVSPSGKPKENETLVVGGVAPTEYVASYELSDFVKAVEEYNATNIDRLSANNP